MSKNKMQGILSAQKESCLEVEVVQSKSLLCRSQQSSDGLDESNLKYNCKQMKTAKAVVANFFFLLHNSQYRFLAARPAMGEMEKPADVAFAALQGTCLLTTTKETAITVQAETE